MSQPLNSTSTASTGLPITRKTRISRLLLIESEPELRRTLRLLLNSQGYQVVTASTVTEAYRLLGHKSFAFVLFDWFLEGDTGLELCRLIRTINKKIPLFFYTTSDGEDGLKQGIEAEVEEYLVNHIEANPILKVIFQHIEKNRHQ